MYGRINYHSSHVNVNHVPINYIYDSPSQLFKIDVTPTLFYIYIFDNFEPRILQSSNMEFFNSIRGLLGTLQQCLAIPIIQRTQNRNLIRKKPNNFNPFLTLLS